MINKHIVNSINNHQLVNDSTLHVITVVSNPVRFNSRYRLARDYIERMNKAANVKLYLVEIAHGDRYHEVTEQNNPQHLQLRSSSEIWLKENMINLGEELLPRNWKYVAWVDGDVTFNNDNWALETIHQLQHYPIVQPWSHCVDMGPYGNTLNLFTSFCKLAYEGKQMQTHPSQPYQYGHSGFAWACRRDFWENVKGLVDFAILGSADHHMGFALLNQVDWSIHKGMCKEFYNKLHDWQRDAYRVTNGHVGYVPGTLLHDFHGSKKARKYRERWSILVDNQFNPTTDLRYDNQGLLYLYNKPHLAEDIKRYFRERNEDSIDE